jgi:hypothetical protein
MGRNSGGSRPIHMQRCTRAPVGRLRLAQLPPKCAKTGFGIKPYALTETLPELDWVDGSIAFCPLLCPSCCMSRCMVANIS